MIVRSFKHAATDARWQTSLPPLRFSLPFRARISTTQQHIEPDLLPNALHPSSIAPQTSKPLSQPGISVSLAQSSSTIQEPGSALDPSKASPSSASGLTPLSSSLIQLLPALHSQTPHYATLHLHGHPYLLTAGDSVRLPFRVPNVQPGDIIRLNRASTIGSRDFTLQGQPYIDELLFECRAVVTGVEAEPMRMKEKTKRRQRRVKTVKSKHRYTVLTVKELKLKSLVEYVALKKERARAKIAEAEEAIAEARAEEDILANKVQPTTLVADEIIVEGQADDSIVIEIINSDAKNAIKGKTQGRPKTDTAATA